MSRALITASSSVLQCMKAASNAKLATPALFCTRCPALIPAVTCCVRAVRFVETYHRWAKPSVTNIPLDEIAGEHSTESTLPRFPLALPVCSCNCWCARIAMYTHYCGRVMPAL